MGGGSGVVNRESAERAAAQIQARFPDADVSISGVFGGAVIDVRADFSLRLTVRDEDSPLLVLFGAPRAGLGLSVPARHPL